MEGVIIGKDEERPVALGPGRGNKARHRLHHERQRRGGLVMQCDADFASNDVGCREVGARRSG